ncbi:MAG: hypothetical protein SGJ19_26690 [Planctomycetia bacterium]|nr:hypothetical protein [Planctomycetia bacterium]
MTETERPSPRTIRQLHVPSAEVSREGPAPEVGGNTHYLTLLSVSSGMVGACLTAVGLIEVVKALNRIETVVDDLLATHSSGEQMQNYVAQRSVFLEPDAQFAVAPLCCRLSTYQ